MKPSIAPAPTDRADLKDRIAQAAVDAVYSRYCSNSVAELESAVVALIGTPIPDEGEDDVDLDSTRRDLRAGDHLVHSGLPEEQGRAAERLAVLTPSPQSKATGLTDTQLLDALASNYWDLRCIDVPTGGDDADIDWIVIEHQMGKPSEVEVERAYRDDPRLAIRRALRLTDKNAARCVSCDEVLHDGDSVYYEHGEGGHIHSHCASEDPESFVDEDEVPLKAGDEIPEPFAYSVETYEGKP